MGCGNSAYKKELRMDLGKKFDLFDFRINPSDEFTFIERAKREISGDCAPDDFMRKLYKGYREFIIEAALEILLSNIKPENGKFISKVTPPPLVDEMWCLAILYTAKYKELCEYLVGGVIDRVQPLRLTHIKLVKSLWPDYSKDFWQFERTTVWVYNKDISYVLEYFYNEIKKSAIKDRI